MKKNRNRINLKWNRILTIAGTCFCLGLLPAMNVQAKTDNSVIKNGIYVGNVNISGMTKEEAIAAVNAYVDAAQDTQVTLIAGGKNELPTTPRELGMQWDNTDVIDEALMLGTEGNVIQRYKSIKDLEHENKVYDLSLSFDIQSINDLLVHRAAAYDHPAKNYTMTRENGQFVIGEGQTGYALDVEASIDTVYNALAEDWDFQPCVVALNVEEVAPEGSYELLSQVKDVLGSYSTSYKTSGKARSANVANGCSKVNGILLYPGDEFSMLNNITPFTEANGYYLAGSYQNGQVVDSFGGGICQVSTTLYNAVLQAELKVTQRNNHSMIINYVKPSMDAAIAESSGKDFKFVNSTDYPIYIEGYTADKKIYFTIYGVETRDTVNRKVTYESEVLETTQPERDMIYADGGQGFGYIVTSSAHVGYKARLWKIVTENGVEVSREQVNTSKYNVSPRSATVGTATDNPEAYAALMAAIESGSIDQCKAVIAAYTVPTTPEVGDQ